MRGDWLVLGLLGVVATTGGCALFGAQGGPVIGQPDWIARGTGLVLDGTERQFVGVGQARDKLRLPLLKQVAQKKATTALEAPVKAFLKALAGPWLQTLDQKFLKEPDSPPIVMLDKLLERCVKLGAIDEVYVEGEGDAVFALARLDLMAVVMEMQASGDVEPLLTFMAEQGVDPNAVFDAVAAGPPPAPPAEEKPAEEKPAEEKPADKAEAPVGEGAPPAAAAAPEDAAPVEAKPKGKGKGKR